MHSNVFLRSLLTAALVVGSSGRSPGPPSPPTSTAPRLTGIFVAIYTNDLAKSASEWDAEFAAMAHLGIRFVAIRAAMRGETNSTAGGCELGTYAAHYATSIEPAACYPRASPSDGGNALEYILDAAANHGLQVHLTPAMPAPPFRWPVSADKAEARYRSLATLQADIFDDVLAVFPRHRSTIVGLYTALEESNEPSWLSSGNAEPMATHYFEALALRFPGLQVWASPYYVGNLTRHPTALTARAFASYWADIWRAAPHFGWVALQDARGKQGNSDAEVAEALAALQTAAAAAAGPRQQQLWSNVELFEGCTPPATCSTQPAPIERIVKQLANEGPFVQGQHIAWEWVTCLSPYTNNRTAQLFHDYASYIGVNATATTPASYPTGAKA